MARQDLTAESIAELHDGKLGVAINRMIRELIRDCHKRATLKKTRTLVIEIAFKPVPDDDGLCETVEMLGTCKTKAPAFHGHPFLAAINDEGRVRFDNLSPDNPDQNTLPFDPPRGSEE